MEGDDYPTRLRELGVAGLGQLVSLPQWLKGSANTLQFLHISFCENLEVLPEWLPDLSSLRQLKIWGCPKLSGRQRLGQDGQIHFSWLDVIRRLFSQKRMFFVLKIATAYQFNHNMHSCSMESLSLLLYCK
nr:hypothetical protein CFP56_68597 [Quercus suber]